MKDNKIVPFVFSKIDIEGIVKIALKSEKDVSKYNITLRRYRLQVGLPLSKEDRYVININTGVIILKSCNCIILLFIRNKDKNY